jgi:hypothetical protein
MVAMAAWERERRTNLRAIGLKRHLNNSYPKAYIISFIFIFFIFGGAHGFNFGKELYSC